MKSKIVLTFLLLNIKLLYGEKQRICYYTNWSQYRNSLGKFVPSNIDVTLCTQIHYAFAKINIETFEIENFEWNDDAMIKEVVALKDQKPSLKVIISVGGWTHDENIQRFSKMVQTPATRKLFINSAIAYMKNHKLDGLSYDWEWPGNRGSPPGDKHKFTLLLQETYSAFQNDSFLLGISVGAGPKVIDTAYEIPEISSYVDWVNIMTYDLHGSWENVTGCSTAMTGPLPTVINSLEIWINNGMPNHKITLGLAGYGRTFTLVSNENQGLGAPARGPGTPGKYTRESGSLAYYEICSIDWDSVTDWIVSESNAPYASKIYQWVGYDTMSSIRNKVISLVNGYNLQGFSFWSLDLDDFTGKFCQMGSYPLLAAANHALKDENV